TLLHPLPCSHSRSLPHRAAPSFPTRRSSDLRFGDGVDLVLGTGRKKILESTADLGIDMPKEIAASGRVFAETLDSIPGGARRVRSEEHTSELQSPDHLVCRLLLEKKKIEIWR